MPASGHCSAGLRPPFVSDRGRRACEAEGPGRWCLWLRVLPHGSRHIHRHNHMGWPEYRAQVRPWMSALEVAHLLPCRALASPPPGWALRHSPGWLSPCSPFEVKVGSECGNQKVRAWGPGLEGGVVGKSADFVVEAIGDDVGTLGEYAVVMGVPQGQRLARATLPGLQGPHGAGGYCQAFRWRAHHKPRSNVMTRVMVPVMCATGHRRLASTRCTCCAIVRTSVSAPSWLTSATHPRISIQTG